MPTTFKGTTQRIVNQTGAPLTAPCLLTMLGFSTDHRTVNVELARANGTSRRAQLLLTKTLGAGRVGYAYEMALLEDQNTSLFSAVGDAAYLSPSVPGAITHVKPTDSTEDLQRIGKVLSIGPTTGRILVDLRGAGSGLAPGELTSAVLTEKPYHDIGRAGFGYIHFTGVTSDGERITINTRIYEFDTGGVIGAGADVAVDISGGNSAAQSATALAAAINGDASRSVNAIALGDAVHIITLGAVNSTGYPLAETCANVTLSAATMTSGATRTAQVQTTLRRQLTAVDASFLSAALGTNEIVLGVFPSTTQPAIFFAQGWLASGQPQLLDGSTFRVRQINAAYWAVTYAEPGAGALFTTGDAITVQVGVPG